MTRKDQNGHSRKWHEATQQAGNERTLPGIEVFLESLDWEPSACPGEKKAVEEKRMRREDLAIIRERDTSGRA